MKKAPERKGRPFKAGEVSIFAVLLDPFHFHFGKLRPVVVLEVLPPEHLVVACLTSNAINNQTGQALPHVPVPNAYKSKLPSFLVQSPLRRVHMEQWHKMLGNLLPVDLERLRELVGPYDPTEVPSGDPLDYEPGEQVG